MDRLKRVWTTMKSQCNIALYNGNIIYFYDEWNNYKSFEQWANNNGFKEDFVLHRKNPKEGYSPDNCEWLSDYEHRFKRGNLGKAIYTTYENRTVSLSELSLIVGINRETLKSRYLKGCRDDLLIRKPNQGLKVCL